MNHDPVLSIHKSDRNKYQASVSRKAYELMGLDEIVFSPDELTIKRPAFDATHTRRVYINDVNITFSFNTPDDTYSHILGKYKVEKESEDEFYLEKIK